MRAEAWNKIIQTQELFKKIVAPLKEHLGINFGYMIVFNDGSYYQIIEDLECLKKWVTNVETSHIFCARNVTTYFDEPYNFTIWPKEPTCKAMEIYKEYGMWNGITVSKIDREYTELYWFTKEQYNHGWHRYFIRNKLLLMKFINLFYRYKKILHVPDNANECLGMLSNGFGRCLQDSEYLISEDRAIKKACEEFLYSSIKTLSLKDNISFREIEVLSMICSGYSYKSIARSLDISERTIKFHVKQVKDKTGIKFKDDLVRMFKSRSVLNLFT